MVNYDKDFQQAGNNESWSHHVHACLPGKEKASWAILECETKRIYDPILVWKSPWRMRLSRLTCSLHMTRWRGENRGGKHPNDRLGGYENQGWSGGGMHLNLASDRYSIQLAKHPNSAFYLFSFHLWAFWNLKQFSGGKATGVAWSPTKRHVFLKFSKTSCLGLKGYVFLLQRASAAISCVFARQNTPRTRAQ